MSAPQTHPFSPTKTQQLRALLGSPNLEFILEAHNGVSARIVEEAGFKGIWASGLALSAQYGVRDNNEASWTQVVEMLEFMADATQIPILLDGDTGYGNFNNMRRLVRKLEQRAIAGVCVEDKLFPKTNSFIQSERQALADVGEFCGKIKAGKDSQLDQDFCIVARVEALIAGWGVPEALRRAEAYAEAGADAILIHSKLSTPREVLEFAKRWDRRVPLVIAPTKYYNTPMEVFRQAGVSLVIWANHLLRAAVANMQGVASMIARSGSTISVEDRIGTVEEIFRLQGADELLAAERRYFTAARPPTRAVILAATRGHALEGLTTHKPKVMVPVAGKPLLARLVDEFKRQGVNDLAVVAGYRADAIDVPGVRVSLNPRHEQTGELASLACARQELEGDAVIVYGDLLFRGYILRDLLERRDPLVAVVDSAMTPAPISGTPDYAYCSAIDDRSYLDQDVDLLSVSNQLDCELGRPGGRWIGMIKTNAQGSRWLDQALNELIKQEDFDRLGVPDLLNYLVTQGKRIKVLYIHGHWLDVNSLEDLERADDFTHGGS
ncbi:MAG: phosphoenolpyruvate mutase [Gammaproteobacteria bacterium]